MRKFLAIITLCLTTSLGSQHAFAERNSVPSDKDDRIQTVYYSEADVVVVEGHYGFITTVEFSKDEIIETVSIGDSEAWSVIKASQPNLLFLKPVERDANTNLTVVSNLRIYTFMLRSNIAKSEKDKKVTFRLKFKYPGQESDKLVASFRERDRIKSLALSEPITPDQWNLDYSFAGNSKLRPTRTFDDGRFTYFAFPKMESLPAIFLVNEDRTETLINFQQRGDYIVVERIGRQFTLRNGPVTTCIFNDGYPKPVYDNASPVPAEGRGYEHVFVDGPAGRVEAGEQIIGNRQDTEDKVGPRDTIDRDVLLGENNEVGS